MNIAKSAGYLKKVYNVNQALFEIDIVDQNM